MKSLSENDEAPAPTATPSQIPSSTRDHQYQVLVEHSPDSICVHTDGVIVFANQAMYRLVSATKTQELIGTKLVDHIHPSFRETVLKRITEASTGAPQVPIEQMIVRLDGTVVDIDAVSMSVVYDGRPSVQTIIRDITDRKRAAETLRESEALFRSQFQFGNIGIAITSPLDQRWLRVNRRLCDMLGYSESELLQKTWTETTYPEDLEIDFEHFYPMLAGELEAYEIDKRFVRKNGDIIYTHLNASCYRNPDGSVGFVIASLQDITEQKKVEHALQESEKRLRFFLDNAPVAIVVTTLDGQVEAFNDRFLELFKVPSPEAAFTFNSRNAYTGDDERERFTEAIKKEGLVTDYETVLRRADGSYVDVTMTSKLITVSGRQAFLTVLLDISGRRQAEEALRVSEETQRTLMDASPDAIFLIDTHGTLLAMNEATARRFGAPAKELLGTNIYAPIPPDLARQRQKYVEEMIQKGKPAYFQDERQGMWLENAIFPVFDGAGTVTKLAVFSRDITERRQSEAALRLAEFSIEHSGVPTYWYDRHSRVVRANEAASAALGYSREELLKMKVSDLDPHFRSMDKWNAGWEWVKAHPEYTIFESHHRHRSGKVFPVEVVSSYFNYGGQEYIFSFVHDITERKEAHERFQRALRELERSNNELTQFAYVASHDLQEPLRMVASFVELLAKRYRGHLDSRADQYIDFAVEGAARMQSLIQGLLSYSRIQTHGKAPETVDCGKVMEEVLLNLSRMVAETGTTIHCGALPVIRADKTQMIQLFQNLLANAMTFKSERPCVIHLGVRREKEEYIFSVSDNGLGIEPQYYQRIFGIFQRLHPRSKYPGTGIGLSICKRIVERHGGRIWVESEPGKGSTFFFTIPDGGGSLWSKSS